MSPPPARLVYSTDPEPEPEPSPSIAPPPHQQTARLSLDRKGRRGKAVTLIAGLQLSPRELAELARTLRRLCGAGGAVKEGVIEIQGDQRARIAEALRDIGYKVKQIGG